jgi:hypothetical protein
MIMLVDDKVVEARAYKQNECFAEAAGHDLSPGRHIERFQR